MNVSNTTINKIDKFYDNISIPIENVTEKNKKVIQGIYNDIDKFYNECTKENIYLNVVHIKNNTSIPYPTNYSLKYFPLEIQNYINESSTYYIESSLKIDKRSMNVKFIFQDEYTSSSQKKVKKYLHDIYVWFHILNKYSLYKCSPRMSVFVYMTNMKKYIPTSKLEGINTIHVNSAFTNSCPVNGDITIYRKEEWFKVFIHETFHAYGMDFSSMNVSKSCERIKKIFKINQDIMLYEAYTETWAEIINVIFCCHSIKLKDKNTDLASIFDVLINVEREHSIMKMIKVLDHVQIKYKMFIDKNVDMIVYHEDTNTFSYYVIKCILLFTYNKFIQWCDKSNVIPMMFKNTLENIDFFCDLIEKHYKSKTLLESLEKVEKNMKNHNKNLRMSYSELS